MTESEWMSSEEPTEMLKWIKGKAKDRRLRLFAVACCRWAWEWIQPQTNRQIVEEVEESIDRLFGDAEMSLAAMRSFEGSIHVEDLLVRDLAACDSWEAANSVAFRVSRVCWNEDEESWTKGYKAVSTIAREVFGNPFIRIPFDASWRSPAVVSAATAAFESRLLPSGILVRDRVLELAEALVLEGCKDREILDHLRESDGHVRGCWAVELALGNGCGLRQPGDS